VIANNLRKMQINAEIDEADIGRITVGQSVSFKVDAFADERFRGKVNQVRLSPNTTQNVVTYSIIIDVDNPQLKLLPGMTANVTVVVNEKEDVLRIPETALRFKPSKELWKQFGLKWNDSLLVSMHFGKGNWGDGGFGKPQDKSTKDVTKDKSDSKQQLKPDSIKAKPDFSKMTPEQRKAFRKKMEERGFSRDAKPEQNGMENFVFTGGANKTVRTSHNRVWILESGKPKAIDVMTGLSDGNFAEVISGLKAGQEFITGVNYKNEKQAAKAGTSAFTPGGFGPRH
jgi:HlyD family secretion protein